MDKELFPSFTVTDKYFISVPIYDYLEENVPKLSKIQVEKLIIAVGQYWRDDDVKFPQFELSTKFKRLLLKYANNLKNRCMKQGLNSICHHIRQIHIDNK